MPVVPTSCLSAWAAELYCSADKMKCLLIIVFSATIATSIFAGEAAVDPQEAAIERLVKQAPKLHLRELLDYNLAKLETVYQDALKKAEDDEHRKALEASQKAWKEFFATDGAVAGWNAKGGSYAYSPQMEQRIYQVRLRIYQLSTPFLQGWQEVPRIPNPTAEQVSGGNGGQDR
jgi:uncharacterized protein YecT (DUF1311 family)